MELEHAIGFACGSAKVLANHPKDPQTIMVAMGCNVVMQNLKDPHVQSFLKGHDENVCFVTTSRNGTFLASGQEGSSRLAIPDAQVIVWDLSQQLDVYHLKGLRGKVRALAFSPDEMFLAGSGDDGTLLVWDMQTGEVVGNMSGPNVATTLIWGGLEPGSNHRRPEYSLFASVAHEVLVYRLVYSVANMQYRISKDVFRMPAGLIREYVDSCISPCGTALLLSTSVGDIYVYQLNNLIYRSSFPVCSGGANAICKIGEFIYVGGGDGSIRQLVGCGSQWDLGQETSVSCSVTTLTSCSAGEMLLAGTNDGTIYEIDVADMRIRRKIQSETSSIVAVSFNKKCSIRFATLSQACQVCIWDLSDYSVVVQARPSRRDVGLSLDFDDFDDQVLVGSASGKVRAYSSKRGPAEKLWEISAAHRDGVSSICASSLYYATGGCRGGVRLWSRSSKAQLFEFTDHIMKRVTALLPDCSQAHLLHSCGEDKSVFTYDLKKEKRMVHHQLTRGGVFTSLSQRLDSENELVTAGTDGRLLTWDCDVSEPVSQVTVGSDPRNSGISFSCVRVSPTTGRFIAAASNDARIRIWRISDGALVATSPGNGFQGITSIAWSPDEKQLVSVGLDKCICVWNFYVDALEGDEEKTGHYK